MEKTITLYKKVLNIDLLWKKLWHYTENYGALIYNEKNQGTIP